MMVLGALARVKAGLKVFPCHQKKPLTENGFYDATDDTKQVAKWWTKWPSAQIGARTGREGNLVVLDLDGARGLAWAAKQTIPPTREIETSPGKKQFWFRPVPGRTIKCSAGVLAEEVDVRGEGGYTICPPSVHHESHKPYRFLNNLPLAAAPDWLLEPARKNGRAGTTDTIPKGTRHGRLLKLAAGLRARGFSEQAILADLIIVNQQHCVPPLELSELEKLSSWAGTKPPGFRGERMETSAEVELQHYDRVERENVKWLVPGRVALGKLTLFVGEPGVGKSLAAIDLASRVSRGTRFPDGTPCAQGGVLILSAEDDPRDTIAPRLDAANADSRRVARVERVKVTLPDGTEAESPFNLERDLEKLEETLAKQPGFKLILIDPLSAYLGKINSWRDTEVRSVLAPAAEFAARAGISIIGIMHMKKADADALLRVSGSIAFVAAARAIWGFGPDPDDRTRRIMVPVKNNLAPLGTGLSYQIAANDSGSPFIVWDEHPCRVDANEVLGTATEEKRERALRRAEAEELLRELLAEGPMPQEKVEDEMKKARISWGTVRRAKAHLHIKARKDGMAGGWVWELPEDAQ